MMMEKVSILPFDPGSIEPSGLFSVALKGKMVSHWCVVVVSPSLRFPWRVVWRVACRMCLLFGTFVDDDAARHVPRI